MKKCLMLAMCLLAGTSIIAQTTTTTKLTAAQKKARLNKTGISGYIRSGRNLPIADVRAFVYKADSSNTILSSAYTDGMGYYETNSTPAGKYNLKLVYPSKKSVMIEGVVIKKGLTNITLRMDEPTADTSLPATDFMPKPIEAKKAKKH